LVQLANPNVVSDVEIQPILANHQGCKAAENNFFNELSQTMATLVPILVRMTTAEDNCLIELLHRKLPWGEFLQQVRVIDTGTLGMSAETGSWRVCSKHTRRSWAGDKAAVRALSEAMMRYGQTQQIIGSMNQPIDCTTWNLNPNYSTTSCR
jgi:hypothetical protein